MIWRGVFNLLKMWVDESGPAERDAIVSDIQELIDDCAQPEKVEGVYVRFDDLDRIASDVRKFKDSLRALVDERGGIGKLAELTAISHCLDFSIPPRCASSSHHVAQNRSSTEFESSSNCY